MAGLAYPLPFGGRAGVALPLRVDGQALRFHSSLKGPAVHFHSFLVGRPFFLFIFEGQGPASRVPLLGRPLVFLPF